MSVRGDVNKINMFTLKFFDRNLFINSPMYAVLAFGTKSLKPKLSVQINSVSLPFVDVV